MKVPQLTLVPVVDEAAPAVGLPLVALDDGRLPRHRRRRRRSAVLAGRADHPRLARLPARARAAPPLRARRLPGRVAARRLPAIVKLVAQMDLVWISYCRLCCL